MFPKTQSLALLISGSYFIISLMYYLLCFTFFEFIPLLFF